MRYVQVLGQGGQVLGNIPKFLVRVSKNLGTACYLVLSLIKFITPKSLLCASLLFPFIGLDSSQLINPDQGIPSIMKHLPEVRIFLIGATKTN